jgi:hypothetical protein
MLKTWLLLVASILLGMYVVPEGWRGLGLLIGGGAAFVYMRWANQRWMERARTNWRHAASQLGLTFRWAPMYEWKMIGMIEGFEVTVECIHEWDAEENWDFTLVSVNGLGRISTLWSIERAYDPSQGPGRGSIGDPKYNTRAHNANESEFISCLSRLREPERSEILELDSWDRVKDGVVVCQSYFTTSSDRVCALVEETLKVAALVARGLEGNGEKSEAI